MMRFSRISRARALRWIDAGQHAAAGDRAHAADGKRALHECPAEFDFAFLWFEHAFQGRFQILGDLVDDLVAANLHALLFGQRARLLRRARR